VAPGRAPQYVHPVQANVFGPGDGLRLTARGSDMLFKATAESTGGRFSFMERRLPPGGRRPPRHVHEGADEAFYVLDGEIVFSLDATEVTAGPGSFVLAPGGVAHTFGNAGDIPARLLIVHAPALDGYFRDLHDLWADPANPPDPGTEQDLMRRHGMRPEPDA
jgi:quercetin dioxygenase-like cupin family protein